jgi:hypothetical protein
MAYSDDGTKEWDPTGGPNGQGAWVPRGNPNAIGQGFQLPPGEAPTAPQAVRTPVVQQVPGAWGHTGDSLDPATGQPISGTNGMAVDRDRYRGMGENPEHPTGPQIDRGASNESRDLSMGSLGMLRDRAMGGSTPAQEQARAQTTGAVNGIQSGVQTIQGGASARAGAGRMGQRIGANIQAQGDQDREALRAREMADAAGQYFGGAQGQRGRDLGLATSQAGLEVGQRGANDQREGFYEGLAQDTQNANLNHQLGRNESDVAATQASNNNNAARDAASRAASQNFANGILGAGQGIAKGFTEGGDNAPKKSDDPWDPKNYSTSDERAKTDVRPLYGPPRKPISDKEAARLKKTAEGYRDTSRASNEAQLAAGPSTQKAIDRVTDDTRDVETIRNGVKKPAPENVYGDIRDEDPAAQRTRAMSEAREDRAKDLRGVGGAPSGYALSRAGQAGDMFYGGPRKVAHEDPDMAPGTNDFRKHGAPVDRDIMTSDANAKRQAFIDGVNHTQQMHDTGEVAPPPAYMRGDEKGAPKVQPKAPENKTATPVAKADPARQNAVNAESERNYDRANVAALAAVPLGFGGTLGAHTAAHQEDQYQAARRPSMPSDERTKTHVHDESPMADANRSMAPSVYAYKPGFAEDEGQHEGEKNVGPMAQNMERDPIAGTAIVKRPDGMLAIDKDKGLKLVMGGLSDLQNQLDSLKKERRA